MACGSGCVRLTIFVCKEVLGSRYYWRAAYPPPRSCMFYIRAVPGSCIAEQTLIALQLETALPRPVLSQQNLLLQQQV